MPEQLNRSTLMVAVALSAGVHMLAGVTIATMPAGSNQPSRGGASDGPTTLLTLPIAPQANSPMPEPKPEPPNPEIASQRPALIEPPEPPPPPEREITAGVDDSTAITETWKGVKPEEAVAQAAPKFEIDQAGYVREEATPGEPAAQQVPPAAPSQPPATLQAAPETLPEPAPREPVEAPTVPNDQQPKPASDSTPLPEMPSPAGEDEGQAEHTVKGEAQLADHADIHLPQRQLQKRAVVPVVPSVQATAPATLAPAQPSVTPITPAQLQSPVPTGTSTPPGIVEDDESAARSATETLTVRPGKPVARAGLRIQTSFARFSVSALLLTKPRSPLVRITFGRDGRVKRAEFVPGQTTGSADVDKPLLDSLYRWSAKGKDLTTIPANDPDAGLTLTFRIVL